MPKITSSVLKNRKSLITENGGHLTMWPLQVVEGFLCFNMCASPQIENGFTRIANEIMEALAGIRISGEARQCLDVILRKTYGFNKREDVISLSQFCLLSKMAKTRVCHSLVKLAKMNLIIAKKGNRNGNLYRFNKDFDTWKPLPKKAITIISLPKKATGIAKKGNLSLPKIGHTKETSTKETSTKETIAGTSPAELFKFPLKEEKKSPLNNPVEIFDSNVYIEKMFTDKKRHIQLMAKYFKQRKNIFPSYKAIQMEIERWGKIAVELAEYPDKQIDASYRYVSEKFKEEWNLNTIAKYINNPIIK